MRMMSIYLIISRVLMEVSSKIGVKRKILNALQDLSSFKQSYSTKTHRIKGGKKHTRKVQSKQIDVVGVFTYDRSTILKRQKKQMFTRVATSQLKND